jgi:putative Holliday junction resolvase
MVAIDYGTKRVGVAVTDPLNIFATGLTTVTSDRIFIFLEEYAKKETIDRFVVGWPMNLNNTPSESMKFVEPFVRALKKRFKDVPVELVDERFTSVMAQKTMIAGGLSKKQRQNKALVDEISASIILQSYLESKRI